MGESRLIVQLIGPTRVRRRFLNWLVSHRDINISQMAITNTSMDHFTLAVLDHAPPDPPVQAAVNYLKQLGDQE